MRDKFQNLYLNNAFLFAAVLEDADTCRIILETLLGAPFGHGLYRYTFENICREQNFPLNNGATKIFFNTKGKIEENVSRELVHFLHYVENTTDSFVDSLDDQMIQKIHHRITQLKKSRKWEGRYMRFVELLNQSERKGQRIGQEQILKLTSHMIQAGEADQIPRLQNDPQFLQSMLNKYHL